MNFVKSTAILGGTFSAVLTFFGASLKVFRPKKTVEENELIPFYDWYFFGLLNNVTSNSTRAILAGLLEGAGALSVLIPVIQDPVNLPLRIPGLSMLTALFAKSTIGHMYVKDKLVPVAATMMAFSSSALITILLADGDAVTDRKSGNGDFSSSPSRTAAQTMSSASSNVGTTGEKGFWIHE